MKLEYMIIIMGKICSGKSFLSKRICLEFGYPVASFGGYLKHYSEIRNLPTDRTSLQNLGESFIKNDYKGFVKEVIEHYAKETNILILEGVRHIDVLKELKNNSVNNISIFVECDIETRYNRYVARDNEKNMNLSFEEFTELDEHNVEQEIQGLKEHSNIFVNSGTIYWDNLVQKLQSLNLTRM